MQDFDAIEQRNLRRGPAEVGGWASQKIYCCIRVTGPFSPKTKLPEAFILNTELTNYIATTGGAWKRKKQAA